MDKLKLPLAFGSPQTGAGCMRNCALLSDYSLIAGVGLLVHNLEGMTARLRNPEVVAPVPR